MLVINLSPLNSKYTLLPAVIKWIWPFKYSLFARWQLSCVSGSLKKRILLSGSGVLPWQVSAARVASSYTWFLSTHSSCSGSCRALWPCTVVTSGILIWAVLQQNSSSQLPSAPSFSSAQILPCVAASGCPWHLYVGSLVARSLQRNLSWTAFPGVLEGRFLVSCKGQTWSKFYWPGPIEGSLSFQSHRCDLCRRSNFIHRIEAFLCRSGCSVYLLFLHSSEFFLLLICPFPYYFNLLSH